MLALWLAWIPAKGGYFPATWYPSAAAALALLALTVILGKRWLPSSGAAQAAILAFSALVAFNYLSILWAASPADALEAANKMLLYLAIGWAFALVPWTPRRLAWVLGAWSIGVAVICAIELARVDAATQLGPFFYSDRYANPLLYPNATAALPAMALWPALLLSARREVPAWARIVFFPVATFLAGFAFLPQSRAALVGLLITTPVTIVLAGRRIALLVRVLLIGAALAVTIPRTVSTYQALSAGHAVRPELRHASQGLLLTTALSVLISIALVLVETRAIPERVANWRPTAPSHNARVALGATLAVVVVAAAVAAASPISHLASSVIKNGRTDASTGSVRLFSATPEERFDYIRVGWKLFEGAPLGGVGAGNFGLHYDAARRFEKHSQYTHNLPIRVLSETGIVGLLLFLATLISLAWGMFAAIRALPGIGRATAVAALAIGLYFLVHCLFDWMDEFPVLASPALAIALAGRDDGSGEGHGAGPRTRGCEIRGPQLASSAPPAGGSRTDRRAGNRSLPGDRRGPDPRPRRSLPGAPLRGPCQGRLPAHPEQAYRDLQRAADVNPLSSAPMLAEGAIAIALEDDVRARKAFQQAIDREDGWYPRLQLAVLLAQAGQFGPALAEVRQAKSMDRDDPLIARATNLILHHDAIDPLAFNQGYVQGAQSDVFRQRAIR